MSIENTEGSGERVIKWVNFTRPIVSGVLTVCVVLIIQYINIQNRLLLLESEVKHIRESLAEIKQDVRTIRRNGEVR